jgi:hypothetical protein
MSNDDVITKKCSNGCIASVVEATKGWTDQQKIDLVGSWGWEILTDGCETDEGEQIVCYTNIFTESVIVP